MKCELSVKESEEICRECDVRELDYGELEFLECEEARREDGADRYHARMYRLFDRDSCYFDFVLEIEYRKSLVMWDMLYEVSWFEDIQ